jgi:hypothetical protein
VLTPFDDYPVHQTPLPLAHAGDGHPNHYDRFWFNGYTESAYFALALGIYPNRGVIDAAFSVVHDGVQRSVFASGRAPLDRTRTSIGPISVEIIEPLRINRLRIDADDQGLIADLTYHARTAAYEEARQSRYQGTTLWMDATRATQLGTWTGSIRSGDRVVPLDGRVYGTKDRSWGIRPIGLRAPAAPAPSADQIFFLWAPLNFDDRCLHYMVFEDAAGVAWAQSAVVMPILGEGDSVYGPDLAMTDVHVEHAVRWAPGLRRSDGATLLVRSTDQEPEAIDLEPLLTFRMKGVGYLHPTWGHGLWHDELVVGGEEAATSDLDTLAPDTVHVQQVMRASWGRRRGLGLLEQLVLGPHGPSGFCEFVDGAPVHRLIERS